MQLLEKMAPVSLSPLSSKDYLYFTAPLSDHALRQIQEKPCNGASSGTRNEMGAIFTESAAAGRENAKRMRRTSFSSGTRRFTGPQELLMELLEDLASEGVLLLVDQADDANGDVLLRGDGAVDIANVCVELVTVEDVLLPYIQIKRSGGTPLFFLSSNIYVG